MEAAHGVRPDAHLRSPLVGIHAELDAEERARRAFDYATRHDLKLKALERELTELGDDHARLVKFVNSVLARQR
jgi:hypothetical protein